MEQVSPTPFAFVVVQSYGKNTIHYRLAMEKQQHIQYLHEWHKNAAPFVRG